MAAKLLAALNRIVLEDTIPDRDRDPAAAAAASSASDRREGSESPFDESRHCKLCSLKFNSEDQLGQHLKGKRHEKSVRKSANLPLVHSG